MRAPRGGKRSTDKRRYILFSLYAWGVPILLTCICAIMQFTESIPKHHSTPNFGLEKCWFVDRKAEMFYFYTPLLIVIICNLTLFLLTAFKIRAIKQETAILENSDSKRHQYERNKQRFNLYLKLFLVMGINWIAELISFFVGKSSPYLWLLTDFCNSIQGIFIFILFVCQKKVKNLIMKRYRHLRYGSTISKVRGSSRFHSGNTVSTSENVTKKSFVSSMDENSIRLSELKGLRD